MSVTERNPEGREHHPLIEFSGVERVYGEGQATVRALDGVDLRIERGEFVAIMGPSGSGKSTAMNVIGCLDTPTAGHYRFEGVEVGRLSRNQRALLRRHVLGFVFQGFNLLPRNSVLENVELPLVYRGDLSHRQRREMARATLAQLGLEGREHHLPSELSGGQQQRVAIARAVVTKPTVVLADEPTGNLDTARSREIMQLLTRLNQEGITIVMVTHEAGMAAYAQRVIRFLDGRISADGPEPLVA